MISEFHLRGWQRIPEVEIVALCDPAPGVAEARRATFVPGARVYHDPADLLAAERLDFVDIITPPSMHAAHCRMARAAGVHVICQKPLCPDPDEAARLVADMRAASRVFAVHENHRFRPWFQEVCRRHAAGFFGRPRFVRFEQLDPYEPAEAFKAESPLGVLFEYGTHLVDMVRALLGEPRGVYARLHHQNPRVRGDSVAHVVFEYPDTTATVEIAWKVGGLQQGGFLLVGDRGEAFYEGRMTRGESARFRLTAGTEVVLDETRSPTDDYVESFHLFERDATLAMLSGRPPVQTGEENLATLALTFAAYRAAAEGRSISLPGS